MKMTANNRQVSKRAAQYCRRFSVVFFMRNPQCRCVKMHSGAFVMFQIDGRNMRMKKRRYSQCMCALYCF